jgi:hypothetical protein
MHRLVGTGRDNYEEDTLQSSLQFVPKTPKVKFQRDNYEEDTLQSYLQFVPKTPKVKFQRDNFEEDTLQSSLQFVPKTPKVKFSGSQSLELDINVANALLLSLNLSSLCAAVAGFVI